MQSIVPRCYLVRAVDNIKSNLTAGAVRVEANLLGATARNDVGGRPSTTANDMMRFQMF